MKKYFAVYNDDVGSGETLEKAYNELAECTLHATLDETEFFEGTKINVEFKIKQVPTKKENPSCNS